MENILVQVKRKAKKGKAFRKLAFPRRRTLLGALLASLLGAR